MPVMIGGRPLVQRCGPEEEEEEEGGLLSSGWADRSRSGLLGSGATTAELLRRFGSFRRRDSESSPRRAASWWRRSNRGRRVPCRELFLSCVWIWVGLSTGCRFCLQLGMVEWRWQATARQWGDDDGGCRRGEWLSAVIGCCWGKRALGRAPVFGLCCCVVLIRVCSLVLVRVFSLVLVRVFSLVCLGLISPYSFELGLVSYSLELGIGVGVKPCKWCHSRGRGRFCSTLVYFCCRFADKRSFTRGLAPSDTMLKRTLSSSQLITRFYWNFRVYLFNVALEIGVWWLEFGGLMVSVTAVSWGFGSCPPNVSFVD
ncbi:uncharacterized protein LOC121050817 [Rosa chinensis]|uniref:uncharacterized protein LOC121050817 n=1 Tax=Rosa chinensis TaxID=74649 RepID=UPI001AD91A6C|nr:uncharacterized protein LOC121050817 [Rosa chinensis]XP_040368007.1 uncharacterized protein LOC121050817 [Rosa chinensis]